MDRLGAQYLATGTLSGHEVDDFRKAVASLALMYKQHISVEDGVVFPLVVPAHQSPRSAKVYGTTEYGGSNNCGTVFALSGPTLSTLHSFTCGADGGNPNVGLIRDNHGNLYGTASGGGANSNGGIPAATRS